MKRMDRTKQQLATSYAPGVLFTLEESSVICESRASDKNVTVNKSLASYSRRSILQGMQERASYWLREGRALATCHHASMSVDDWLLNDGEENIKNIESTQDVVIISPSAMDYTPVALSFRCDRCGKFKEFRDIKEFNEHYDELKQSVCHDGESCAWRQLDVVFVHPNGNWKQASTVRPVWNEKGNKIIHLGRTCKDCGSSEWKLDTRSAKIGEYFFYCSQCGKSREQDNRWLQSDREYEEALYMRDKTVPEKRMKAISYRAGQMYYVHQGMVVDFQQSAYLDSLLNHADTKKMVAEKFDRIISTMSDEEKEQALIDAKGEEGKKEWNEHQDIIRTMGEVLDSVKAVLQEQVTKQENAWSEENIFSVQVDLSDSALTTIQDRQNRFAHKFDPCRLMAEHQSLVEEVLKGDALPNGLKRYVPVDALDHQLGSSDQEKRDKLNERHQEILDRTGIEEMGLIRGFKTVHYSFGYSRVSSKPTTKWVKETEVPVRLKLFNSVTVEGSRNKKIPVYVLPQDNEAIYVRLKEENVKVWLQENGAKFDSTQPLGLTYLESVPPMDTFLNHLEAQYEDTGPNSAIAIYMLLHTFAHHVLGTVSEYAGLNLGSLGEHIFPSDLAFVVYRRGSTADLGNISAAIRSNAPSFIEAISSASRLGCSSGSLCTSRGGACPGCVMIPEVSCLTQNKLLSRSVLIGKGTPGKQFGFNEMIGAKGYFDVAASLQTGSGHSIGVTSE